jgi:hypothetical protein
MVAGRDAGGADAGGLAAIPPPDLATVSCAKRIALSMTKKLAAIRMIIACTPACAVTGRIETKVAHGRADEARKCNRS